MHVPKFEKLHGQIVCFQTKLLVFFLAFRILCPLHLFPKQVYLNLIIIIIIIIIERQLLVLYNKQQNLECSKISCSLFFL